MQRSQAKHGINIARYGSPGRDFYLVLYRIIQGQYIIKIYQNDIVYVHIVWSMFYYSTLWCCIPLRYSISSGIIFCYIVLYDYVVLYCFVFYYISLCSIILKHIISYCVSLCYITLHYITWYYIILYHIISYYIILYHIISYYIILDPIISYYIILCVADYIIFSYSMLYDIIV